MHDKKKERPAGLRGNSLDDQNKIPITTESNDPRRNKVGYGNKNTPKGADQSKLNSRDESIPISGGVRFSRNHLRGSEKLRGNGPHVPYNDTGTVLPTANPPQGAPTSPVMPYLVNGDTKTVGPYMTRTVQNPYQFLPGNYASNCGRGIPGTTPGAMAHAPILASPNGLLVNPPIPVMPQFIVYPGSYNPVGSGGPELIITQMYDVISTRKLITERAQTRSFFKDGWHSDSTEAIRTAKLSFTMPHKIGEPVSQQKKGSLSKDTKAISPDAQKALNSAKSTSEISSEEFFTLPAGSSSEAATASFEKPGYTRNYEKAGDNKCADDASHPIGRTNRRASEQTVIGNAASTAQIDSPEQDQSLETTHATCIESHVDRHDNVESSANSVTEEGGRLIELISSIFELQPDSEEFKSFVADVCKKLGCDSSHLNSRLGSYLQMRESSGGNVSAALAYISGVFGLASVRADQVSSRNTDPVPLNVLILQLARDLKENHASSEKSGEAKKVLLDDSDADSFVLRLAGRLSAKSRTRETKVDKAGANNNIAEVEPSAINPAKSEATICYTMEFIYSLQHNRVVDNSSLTNIKFSDVLRSQMLGYKSDLKDDKNLSRGTAAVAYAYANKKTGINDSKLQNKTRTDGKRQDPVGKRDRDLVHKAGKRLGDEYNNIGKGKPITPFVPVDTSNDHRLPDIMMPQLTDSQRNTVFLCRKVKSLLNKITPDTFRRLTPELIGYMLSASSSEQYSALIKVVYEKAVHELLSLELYTELVNLLCELGPEFPNPENEAKPVNFRSLLLLQCRNAFYDIMAQNWNENELLEKYGDDLEGAAEERTKRALIVAGNMKFIGELFVRRLINSKCFQTILSIYLYKNLGVTDTVEPSTIKPLWYRDRKFPKHPIIGAIPRYRPHVLHGMVDLLISVGQNATSVECNRIVTEHVIDYLVVLRSSGLYDNNLNFKIDELVDIYANGWTKVDKNHKITSVGRSDYNEWVKRLVSQPESAVIEQL